MHLKRLLETCLYAEDLRAAEEFYCGKLGLTVYAKQDKRHLFFRLGEQMLLIFNPKETQMPTQALDFPSHGAFGQGHLAFAIGEDEIDSWRKFLQEKAIAIEKEIAWSDGGYSIYFRDPAGNSLELATPMIWGVK